MEVFLDILDSVSIPEMTDEQKRLYAFRFSLRDRAIDWYRAIPKGSITTWNGLYDTFMGKYFPPKKVAELRMKINSFVMLPGESYYEAWERFKGLLVECPTYGQG